MIWSCSHWWPFWTRFRVAIYFILLCCRYIERVCFWSIVNSQKRLFQKILRIANQPSCSNLLFTLIKEASKMVTCLNSLCIIHWVTMSWNFREQTLHLLHELFPVKGDPYLHHSFLQDDRETQKTLRTFLAFNEFLAFWYHWYDEEIEETSMIIS